MPRASVSHLPLALVLTLALACNKEPASPPKFEPGPRVDKTLAKLGGVTLSVPDNLTIEEREGTATLTAEGFPTVTITRAEGSFDMTGTRVSTKMSGVKGVYSTPTSEWTCTADDAMDHEKLIVSICESLTAAVNPNVGGMTCKTVTGYESEAVLEAWTDTAERFAKCLAGTEHTGLAFGFNFVLDGDSRNFTTYTSPILRGEASGCMAEVYDALEASPAFNQAGLEAGQIECDGRYSKY